MEFGRRNNVSNCNFNNTSDVLGLICRANSCSGICDTNYLMYISSPFNYRERREKA